MGRPARPERGRPVAGEVARGENAVRAFIAALAHKERDARELDVINRHADWLNQEAEDVLAYQVEL